MKAVSTVTAKCCCFLISSLAGGGAEGVCVNIANGLAGDDSLDIELLVLNMHKSVYHERLSSSVKLTVLGVSQARYAFIPLIRYLNKLQPEKLVVFNYELAVIIVLIKPFLRFKLEIIARNINTLSVDLGSQTASVKTSIMQQLLGHLYGKVDHIVNQCEGMQQDLLSTIQIAPNRTSVIYNPVNSYIEQHSTNNIEITQPAQPYILCAGRLELQKAFDLAIKAFTLLSLQYPQYRLKIVGEGSLEFELRALAEQLQIADKVDFEGFQRDILPYYQNAKFTLLTSRYEGFPNVLVESITLGTPIVAVKCPSGPDEIIVQGVNGYLVDSKDENILAGFMLAAVQQQWSRQQIMTTASRFSGSNIIRQWCELLLLPKR